MRPDLFGYVTCSSSSKMKLGHRVSLCTEYPVLHVRPVTIGIRSLLKLESSSDPFERVSQDKRCLLSRKTLVAALLVFPRLFEPLQLLAANTRQVEWTSCSRVWEPGGQPADFDAETLCAKPLFIMFL